MHVDNLSGFEHLRGPCVLQGIDYEYTSDREKRQTQGSIGIFFPLLVMVSHAACPGKNKIAVYTNFCSSIVFCSMPDQLECSMTRQLTNHGTLALVGGTG